MFCQMRNILLDRETRLHKVDKTNLNDLFKRAQKWIQGKMPGNRVFVVSNRQDVQGPVVWRVVTNDEKLHQTENTDLAAALVEALGKVGVK